MISKVNCRCVVCGSDFMLVASDVRRGRGKYCSHKCYTNSKILPRITEKCWRCGKLFRHLKSRTKAKFCSNACAKSGARILYNANPANRTAIVASMRHALTQKWKDPRQRELTSRQSLKRWSDSSYKKKVSANIKAALGKVWARTEYREKRIRELMRRSGIRPTKIELQLKSWLDKSHPGEFVYNGSQAGIILAGHVPDFVNVNGQKKLIEVFGCYWHGCQPCGQPNYKGIRRQQDKQRLADFKQLGWDCLVVWQHEFEHARALKAKISNFIESKQ